MLNFLKNLFKQPYETLSGSEFKARFSQTKGAVLLDVRTPAEFKSGAISGAKNLDVTSAGFAEKAAKLDKSKTYFLYCRSGARSGQACSFLSQQGYTVYNLSGGIGSWPR
ncbi:MAG: rhodanese-like domain-containing protein [Bacteroidia bacterium]|nr:rhodanese-like domain-containing protein [Bacteroidia bacterium]